MRRSSVPWNLTNFWRALSSDKARPKIKKRKRKTTQKQKILPQNKFCTHTQKYLNFNDHVIKMT